MQTLSKLIIGIKSVKIHSDHLFLLQIYFQETRNNQVSQMNRTPPYEALFGGESRAGLARMNLGDLENRVSTAEQLLEVLDDNNEEEEDAEEVEATLVIGRVTLDKPRGGRYVLKIHFFH